MILSCPFILFIITIKVIVINASLIIGLGLLPPKAISIAHILHIYHAMGDKIYRAW